MIKAFVLLCRRDDLDAAAFRKHWREVHAPLARRLRQLRRYTQSDRLDFAIPGFPACPYDGISEIWFDDLATALALPQDPDYRSGLYLDEPNFIDRSRMQLLFTREHVIIESDQHERPPHGVKSMFFIKRRPDMSPRDFQDYWLRRHAPLVYDTPGLLRYLQCHTAPECYAAHTPPFDGVAELWWPDRPSFERAAASPAIVERQAPDWTNFVGPGTLAVLVEEHPVPL